MKTVEIINNVCDRLNIPKADLAKRMGLFPSSFYRKLSNESMTFEELQKCLDAIGVSVELRIQYDNEEIFNSFVHYDKLVEKLNIIEKKLEVITKQNFLYRNSLKDLRTELNSAIGYVLLCQKHENQKEEYCDKLQIVHRNMKKIIAFSLGDESDEVNEIMDEKRVERLKGSRILLVEDNELNSEMLEEVLVDNGLLVDKAKDGKEALEMIGKNVPSHYQFIIMDIEMPKMDGYEATLRIRMLPNRIRANIPIVAFTANNNQENKEKAMEVGMDGFLAKPLDTNRLLLCLARLM